MIFRSIVFAKVSVPVALVEVQIMVPGNDNFQLGINSARLFQTSPEGG